MNEEMTCLSSDGGISPRCRWLAAAVMIGSLHAGGGALAGPRADDLAFAKNEYVLRSPAFRPEARAQAVSFIDEAAQSADEMSPEQFLLCMFRVAAFADNGHDALNAGDDAWFPDARLPLRMLWFRDNWVIARADEAHADLAGALVLRIEHRSSAEVFRTARSLFGGTDGYRRWNAEPLLENAGVLHALGLAEKPDRLRLELVLADGRHVTRTLRFVKKSDVPKGQEAQRIWSPAPWPGEREHGWARVNPEPTPLYLREGERSFRVARLGELDSVYLQMRTHLDAPGEPVAGFEHQADDAINHFHPRNLIVDLRFDSGGNTDLTRAWQRSLPARVPGLIYVVVGPYTFSAGIVAAAAFKHDAPDRVRIVGEAVGDRLSWWSEGTDVCARNSKYCFHRTSGLWDLVRGCAGRPGCYGDKYDAQVGSLNPDLHAPLTAKAFLAGRDPAMEAISRDIGAGLDSKGRAAVQ